MHPKDIDIVIYHKNCADGMGSAFSIWYYYELNQIKRHPIYYPAIHNTHPPDVKDKNVLICDFSYKKNVLTNMIKEAKDLLVIDHHISAQKDLEEIDSKYKVFDMDHSGAVLTWMHIFPEKEIPLLLRYIEDRDIWKKKLPNTDAFASFFYLLPFDFQVYKEYLNDEFLLNEINTKGINYLTLNEHNVKQISKHTSLKFSRIGNKFYFVGYVNSNVLKSDIGSNIFDVYPHVSFSVVYSVDDNRDNTTFSLRSRNEYDDVSQVATLLGGGGHRNASGVMVENVQNVLPSRVYDVNKLYELVKNIYFDSVICKDGKELNIVYLSSNSYQWELGKYLLQDRYNKPHQEKWYQNCTFLNNLYSDIKIDKHIQCAFVWSFDGLKQKITHVFDTIESKESFMKTFGVRSECLELDVDQPLVKPYKYNSFI